MRKLALVMLVISMVLIFASSVLGKATFLAGHGSDPNFSDADNRFEWVQWPGYDTMNDWEKVGSLGYETYWDLIADVDTAYDQIPREDGLPKLIVKAKKSFATVGVYAGYDWYVPTSGDGSNQVVVGAKINLRWAFPLGISESAVLRMLDEGGNTLWRWESPSGGYFVGENILFFDKPTKKIRFVVNVENPKWVWINNTVEIYLMSFYTIDDFCGRGGGNYPAGDLNQDCLVDHEDLFMLTQDWMQEGF